MIDFEKCRLTFYPARVLGEIAKPVEKIDDDICKLVDLMSEVMVANKGLGLAAPQVGVSLRLFIISVDGTKENIKVYINPTISPGGGLETNEEGCLSVPGIFTNIKRYKTCKVTATDLQGNEFSEQGQELLTRAMQHENDHLEGITIVDKMGHSAKILHRKQLKKLIEDHRR